MKKSILTTLLFAVLYFLCMGIGVLLGNLFDQTGNMFYAPAFTGLVGGSVYMILVAKVPRFGAITTIGLVMALFFLGTKHGAGAFLPGIICGLLADGVASLGKYKDQTKNFLSFILFAFSSTGPILLMWIAPKAYGYPSGKRKIPRIYRPYHGSAKFWNHPSFYRKCCHRSPIRCLNWTSLK